MRLAALAFLAASVYAPHPALAAKFFQLIPPTTEGTFHPNDMPLVRNPPATTDPANQLIAIAVETPTRDEIAKAFPAGEVGKVDQALVVLRCGIGSDGLLKACQPASEQPAHRGFGAAAMGLSKSFRYMVFASPGDPTKDIVLEIPIAFHDPAKPAPPVRISNPVWTRRFDPDKLAAIYPSKALAAGVKTGKGVVECDVAHSGRLTDCQVVGEAPPGTGFGDAALTVAAAMAMNPWTETGEPVDGARIRLPINLAGSAPPEPAAGPGAAPAVAHPNWVRMPSGDDIAAVYPREALAHGLGGRVVMRCAVTDRGTLDQCAVISEAPPNAGFGAALLALAKDFKMAPSAGGRLVAGAHVDIPVVFNPPPT